ncbi:MAG: hypothetical protein KAS13_08260 [Candidatus Omnitrophica bacterium]|nr:hypothetical protein [Candidatus Omnitrophota bacterium]
MKLISKLLLIMYFCFALTGITYAAGSITAGIFVLSLNPALIDLGEQGYSQMQTDAKIPIKIQLIDFAQDIPQMQCYDWSNVRQENEKLFAFLCEI